METSNPPDPEPYTFRFDGGPVNTFRFTTEHAVSYEVKFVPSSEYFADYATFDIEVFEMIIAVADNPIGGRPRFDERIEPTIFAIFEEFFDHHRYVIIFICETRDGRGLARHRKFGAWFSVRNRRTGNRLIKIDLGIYDGPDLDVTLSMILNHYHPHRPRLVELFLSLGEGAK